jgi:hypothetical protein
MEMLAQSGWIEGEPGKSGAFRNLAKGVRVIALKVRDDPYYTRAERVRTVAPPLAS